MAEATDNPRASGARDPDRPPALIDYLDALWSRAWLILAMGAALAVVSIAWDLSSSPVYSAEVGLLVVEPKSEGIDPVQVSIPTFSALIENRTLGAQVVDELGLDASPHNLTGARFIENRVQVERIGGSLLFSLHVQLSDPQLAADAANRLAELAVELGESIGDSAPNRMMEFLGELRDQQKDTMDTAAARLLAFEEEAQIDLLESEADALLQQHAQLVPLQVEIEAERASLAQTELELAEHERVLQLTSAFDPDALAELAAAGDETARRLLGAPMTREEINAVYQSLEEKEAVSRVRLAELERRRSELVDGLGLERAQLSKLSELYGKRQQLAELELELELARDAYADVSSRYSRARVVNVSRSGSLTIIDPATAPDRAIAPRTTANAQLALLAGLLLGCVVALLLDYVAGARAARSS